MKINHPERPRNNNGCMLVAIGLIVFALLVGSLVFAYFRFGSAPRRMDGSSAEAIRSGGESSEVTLNRSSNGFDWEKATNGEKDRICRQIAAVFGDEKKAVRLISLLDDYYIVNPRSKKISDALIEIYAARE